MRSMGVEGSRRRALLALVLAACSSSTTQGSNPDASRDASSDGTARRDATDANHDARPHEASAGDAARDAAPADGTFDAFTFDAGDAEVPLAPWTTEAAIFVNGFEAAAGGQTDCRTQICQHNEDTDMIAFGGAIFMVHRTAESQILGPNSSLLVYESTDDGVTFAPVARILAPLTPIDGADDATMGRDIRDPAFFIVADAAGQQTLHLKAITRLPTDLSIDQTRDSNVESISVGMSSSDGVTWTPLARLAPNEWSFWRVKEVGGVFYTAAYHDGDSSVSLFSSVDGVTWTEGAQIFGTTPDTPLETELVPMPNGDLLALVRTDGSNEDLAGDDDNQRTRVCWSSPPYATWSCPETLLGERFDGPVAFFSDERLFVIARRHIESDDLMRKRTSLFELQPTTHGAGHAPDAGPSDAGDAGTIVAIDSGTDATTAMSGDWGAEPVDAGADGGIWDTRPLLAVKWWGDLPSAGDTAYAGVAFTDTTHVKVVWYAGDLTQDEAWYLSLLGPTNIWLATIDLSLVR
jgi:hypothetical protein